MSGNSNTNMCATFWSRIILTCVTVALAIGQLSNVEAQTLRTFSEQTSGYQSSNGVRPNYANAPNTQTLLLDAATHSRSATTVPKNLGLDLNHAITADEAARTIPATPTQVAPAVGVATGEPVIPKTSASKAFDARAIGGGTPTNVSNNAAGDMPSVGNVFSGLVNTTKKDTSTKTTATETHWNDYAFIAWSVGGIIGLISSIYLIAWLTRYLADKRRAKQMMRLVVTLPKKESSADKEKEVTHDYKEALAAAEQLLTSLSSTYSALDFFTGQDYFGFEIAVRNSAAVKEKGEERAQVTFHILTLPRHRAMLERQVVAFYPDADIAEITSEDTIFAEGTVARAVTFTQRAGQYLPIKTYKNIQEDAMNALVNGVSQVRDGEGAALQILFAPAKRTWITAANERAKNLQSGKANGSFFSMLIAGDSKTKEQPQASPLEQEQAKAIGEKVKKVGFHATIRIVTTAKDTAAASATLGTISSTFSQFEETQANALVPSVFANEKKIIRAYHAASLRGPETPILLNVEEIATLIHLPDHRFNQAPNIRWLSFRRVPAPANTPTEGIELGTNDFHNATTPVHIKRDDRTRHFYCIGKSGSGKSTLLEYMIKQDIRNGEGVCVIDPHGDLAEAVLPYIPKERIKDVIYFNPGDLERPVGLNLLEAPPDKRDFITGQALQIFIKLFGEEVFGPRLQHYFRNACLTLMDDEEEGGTLIEVPRLFIDPEFQKRKVAKVKNPVVRAFWEKEIANTGDREKQEMIPYLTSKFGQFITDSVVRNIIGQPVSGLDLRKAMDEQKIVLVNLAKGVIGEQNMSLLGMILITKVQMAAMSRFDTAAKDRKDFYLYVDEFQNFATDAFGSILSEARKYRLNLVVAHQYIKQLKDEIRDAVFGNVGSMMCFKIGAADAEYMAKEFAPVYSEQDIVNIPNYKAYIKLCIDNATSTAFSLNTVWDKSGKNEALGEKIKALARMKIGRDRKFVDEETRARAGG